MPCDLCLGFGWLINTMNGFVQHWRCPACDGKRTVPLEDVTARDVDALEKAA